MNNLAIEILPNSTITATGVENDIPYLQVSKQGQSFRAWIYGQSEGNDPGFIFGLPLPDSLEIKALQRQVRERPSPELRAELEELWTKEYYRELEELTIVAIEPGEDFPQVVVDVDGQEHRLEVSADQEGNYGGYLLVEPLGS